MKRFYFLLTLLIGFMTVNATVQLPRDFYENFKGANSYDYPLDNWICSGLNDTPADPQGYFERGENWIILTDKKDRNFATCNSSFKMIDGKYPTADEWLISPEFTISEDNVLLQFTTLADGSSRSSEYNVYIAEGASTPDQFKAQTPVYSGKLRNNISTETVDVKGFKGKKVRLAFNNISQNAAYLGFTNIEVAAYLCDVLNNTPAYVVGENEVEVAANAWISTLMDTEGMIAKLVASDGTESTYTSDTDCKGGHTYRFVFPDKITLSPETPRVTYTITITPRYEGAPSIVIDDFVTRSAVYLRTAVMEEYTGTWCPNCTRGAAALEKYADNYPGQFIGIALHGNDPMQSSYSSAGGSKFGITGFPSAVFSRDASKIGDPTDEYLLKKIVAEPTYAAVHVSRINYDASSKKMAVKFDVRNGYAVTDRPYNVAVAILENKVTGTGSSWEQANGLAGASKAAVDNAFGEGWWPYIQPYAQGSGKMTMEYNHVGRAIYPKFEGYEVADKWEADTPVEDELTFTMSSEVTNWENTTAVVMLLDPSTGEVLNAAKVEAADYNKDLPEFVGINDSFAEVAEANAYRFGDTLVVNAEAGSTVRVYSAAGTLLGSYNHNGGELFIDGSAFNGVLIVRIDGNSAPAVKKLIWK